LKKSKAQNVDLLYVSEDEKKNKKSTNVAGNKKPATKKNGKKRNISKEEENFNFDDEIVIGITKKEDEPKKNKKKKKEKKKKENVKKQVNQTKKNTKKKEEKNNKKTLSFAKYLVLIVILAGSIICFMLSPVFDIKTITIINNSKLSREEIISLSGITIDENTFKISTGQAEKNIKENPYVESVKVSRKLPSEILIDITERIPTFMIDFVNSVIYINNQGYMLEITEEKLEVPTITGINTAVEDFKEGNRLCKEDLQKLETVLKIVDTADSYGIKDLITWINIADKNNFTLYLEGEKKTVYLGNASNINMRIMYLKELIELEKGIESEFFINGDINKDDVYTREKV